MVGEIAVGMRWGTLLVAGTLLFSACSDSPAEPTTTPAPTTDTVATTTTTTTTAPQTTTTTTTTAAPTTTPVDSLARPEVLVSNFDRQSIDDFDTTGDDLYRVVMELADLFNYLEGNPLATAEEMTNLLLEPGYPHREQILSDFLELTDNSWRYADAGIETVGIEVLQVSGDRAAVKVADQREDQIIVSPDGEIQRIYRGWDLDIATFTFRRGDDGRWRYADVGAFTEATPSDLENLVSVEWTGRTP